MLYKDIKMKPSQSGLCPPLHLPTLWGILLYCRFLGTARDKPSQELGWISLPARWGAQQPGNTNTSLLLLLKSADNNATLIYFVMLPTFPEEFKWKQEMTKKIRTCILTEAGFRTTKRSFPTPAAPCPSTKGCWGHRRAYPQKWIWSLLYTQLQKQGHQLLPACCAIQTSAVPFIVQSRSSLS